MNRKNMKKIKAKLILQSYKTMNINAKEKKKDENGEENEEN